MFPLVVAACFSSLTLQQASGIPPFRPSGHVCLVLGWEISGTLFEEEEDPLLFSELEL